MTTPIPADHWTAAGEALLPELIELRRAIHEEPELGLDTPLTTAKAKAALAGLPLEIREGGSTSGIVAVLKGPQNGRTVLLRGDMDALPLQEDTGLAFTSRVVGAMHACGHDTHVAMLTACTTVLRGAGYAAFNGELPAQPMQWALAAEYTHATAPLRRLVDRYTGEVCVALCAKQPVPEWVLAALPGLPATMQASGHRARQYEKAVLDLAEAEVLASRVGESFDGAVVEVMAHDPRKGVVIVRDPAVEAGVSSEAALPLGADVRVTLVEADPGKRLTRFELSK